MATARMCRAKKVILQIGKKRAVKGAEKDRIENVLKADFNNLGFDCYLANRSAFDYGSRAEGADLVCIAVWRDAARPHLNVKAMHRNLNHICTGPMGLEKFLRPDLQVDRDYRSVSVCRVPDTQRNYETSHHELFLQHQLPWPPVGILCELEPYLGQDATKDLGKLTKRQQEIVFFAEHVMCYEDGATESIIDLGATLKATTNRATVEIMAQDNSTEMFLPENTIPPITNNSTMWVRSQGRALHVEELLRALGIGTHADACVDNDVAAFGDNLGSMMNGFLVAAVILATFASMEKAGGPVAE